MRDILRTLLSTGQASAAPSEEVRLLRERADRLGRREQALGQAAADGGILLFELDLLLRPVWTLGPLADALFAATSAAARRPLEQAATALLADGRRQTVALDLDGQPLQLSLAAIRDGTEAIIGIAGTGRPLPKPAPQPIPVPPSPAPVEPARTQPQSLGGAELLARAGHDLRQPAQAMRLYLHLLQAKIEDAGQLELCRRLEEAVDSGSEQLNAVLDLAALDAGRIKVAPTTVPLGPVLARTAEALQPMAMAKGLTLRVRPTGLSAHTDPVLLDRILRALAGNAVRFTDSGRVLLGVRRQGARVAVQVWDTGPGIPPEQQQEVFKPFVQLSSPGRARQGLGLGLTLAERTAHVLGLELRLRSTPDRGCCVTLLLPREQPVAAAPPAPAKGAGTDLAGRLIAVAEDDRLQLAALEATLQDWGCRTACGGSMAEVQAALRDAGAAPDLVISDFRLPGGQTGLTLVASIRAEHGRSIPGLLLTGDAHPDTQAQADAAGLRILHKPVPPNRLRKTLEQILAPAAG